MAEAIGIRLEKDSLKKLEKLSKEETLDRNSIIRRLVYMGYQSYIKGKVLQRYKKGEITVSEATHQAGLTYMGNDAISG